MITVSYAGARGVYAPAIIVRMESDEDETICTPFESNVHGREEYDWGRPGPYAVNLAVDLLAEVLKLPQGALQQLWPTFYLEVVVRLPQHGWTLTAEAVIDWWLGGISTTLSPEAYDAVCDGRAV